MPIIWLFLISCLLVGQDAAAQFGSAPIHPKSPVTSRPVQATAPQATTPAYSPVTTGQAAAPMGAAPGKKWIQHDSGYVLLVDADQPVGAGFRVVGQPVQQSTAPSASYPTTAAAPSASPGLSAFSQPPQAAQTFSSPAFSQPVASQAPMNAYSPAPAASSGTPPGKKWMQHKSGYRVIVDQSTVPGPEFTEIPAPNTAPMAAAPSPYQQPAQGYGMTAQPMAPQAGYSQPQTYSAPAATGGPQTYSQIPMTGQMTPAQPYQGSQQPLANLPPNMQRQLPYQPPTPPGVAPPQVPYQSAYAGQMMGQGGGQPAVRSAPPGKKWVQSENGMRYLVDRNTIPGPGFREISDEEASRPIMLSGPPPQQQQQQQQQQPQQGGFFSFLGNLGRN
ncbi:hypothetical protein L6Q85_03915 [bacterium]|nr:hypothetical protein [bacterium]NUP93776.1 hypothetical protein [Candidatus Omnitrophota bacterium]